ncbi:MAG: CerR family C-terminal domain-containing protein [Rhizobiaceae bacterium]
MTTPPDPTAQSGNSEMTRSALVRASLKLFGQKGFEGTSTREIAAAARANIGSIAYHFGGKEGLRAACAAYIVQTVQGVASQALAAEAAPVDANAARARLHLAAERLVSFVVARPEAGEIVQFVLREMAHPTDALDTIYDGVFLPVHARLCGLWAMATGQRAEAEHTKIAVFTMIGQAVYFRIGREAVLRRMGWSEIGPDEAAKILAVVHANIDAALSQSGGKP